jgi:hypothetical protein
VASKESINLKKKTYKVVTSTTIPESDESKKDNEND